MTSPTPTRKDHQDFCTTEGWTLVRNARGKTGHHVTYELGFPDARILRTRVTHPIDRTDCGPRIWSHILKDQLQVTDQEFWDCVHQSVVPSRGAPQPPDDAIPAALIYQLVIVHRMPEQDVAKMSKSEVMETLTRLWSQPTERET